MEWRKDLGVAGLLGAAVAIFFWPAAALEGAFFVQDVMVQNHPFRDFFARALRQGQLPLWNAAINCGFPLFAEGQAGALYPPNVILALMLPTWAALNWNIVLHLWLAGVGMYALVRAFGAVRPAALCAGLCYALSGYMVVRAMSPNFIAVCAWLPLLFWLVDRILNRGRFFYVLLFALVIGLQLLAGHPQAALYGAVAVAGYWLYRSWVQGAGWVAWLVLAGAFVLGAAIAAVQLVPTAELVQLSNRGAGLSWPSFVAMSLPPERLATLLWPNLFGNSAHGTYGSREMGFFIQLCAYVGAVPLFLAWAALRERREGQVGFFTVLALAGLVLALGKYTAIFSFFHQIPGFSLFRIPTRFLLWFALGASVLCGLGLDQVLRRERQRPASGWLLAAVLGAASVGLLWASGVALFGDGSEPTRYIHHLRGDGLRLVGALVIGVWLLSRRARRAAAWAAPVAIFVELYSFGADFNGTIEPTAYTETPATAREILADHTAAAPPRIVSLVNERNSPFDWHGGWVYDLESYRRYNETLRMYSGGLYGVANALPGWSPLHLYRHGEFARGYPSFAALAGVEYAVRYSRGEGFEVQRLSTALPRAYVVGQFHLANSPRAGLSYMARGFPMRREVVLEKAPTTSVGPGGAAQIVRYEDEEVAVSLTDSAGGILVLSDTYYPGWRAFVDGVERPILRANHVFRAVEVPAGAQEVVFSYEPDSFRYGLLISVAAVALWLGLAWGGRRLILPPVQDLPADAGAEWRVWAALGALVFVLHAIATQGPLWSEWIERLRLGVGS